MGFTEFAPDAGGSLHNQTDILAVYKLLTTYAHVDEHEKFLQTISATSLFYFLCYLMRLEKLIPKEVATSEIGSGYSKDYMSQTSEVPPPFLFVNRIFTMNKHDFKKNQAVLIDQFFGLLACRSKVERDARNLEKKAFIEGDYRKEETFAPKINKSSRLATSRDDSLSQREYGDLLSKRSDTKQLKIEILRAEKREKEMAECSFVPYFVSRKSSNGSHTRNFDAYSARTGYRPQSEMNAAKHLMRANPAAALKTTKFKFINLDASAARSNRSESNPRKTKDDF